MQNEQPGIAFEKAVATIQMQLDPAASVTHNEILIDRLGHARQFDVVIRGAFAGQQMLGVIECKDLKRKVGTPEIDAFKTKAEDINANFKILMSKSGFSKPALEKCAHYGMQALSLIEDDPNNRKFFVGTRWTADITRWRQLAVSLKFVEQPTEPVGFSPQILKINKKRVLDWYTNYLLDHENEFNEFGWVADLTVTFDTPQLAELQPGFEVLCQGISFKAERVQDKLQRLVGLNGTGFYNWNSQIATFPPGTTIQTDPVPTDDFSSWSPRSDEKMPPSGFIDFHMNVTQQTFEYVTDALDLGNL